MSWRCPACGYTTGTSMTQEAKLLMEERSDAIQSLIKKCINLVNLYVYKGDMPIKYVNQFMYSIGMVYDEEVLRGIRVFLDKEYYKTNMNLAYLGGIIKNIHQTKESQANAEKILHGLNPPEMKKEK